MSIYNDLTPAQLDVLARLERLPAVFAGDDVEGGRVVRTNASTLFALERRGLVVLSISPDGGMLARKAPEESEDHHGPEGCWLAHGADECPCCGEETNANGR